MLKNCPECEHLVSDRAAACPNCGYPLIDISRKSHPGKFSNRRRRLPNGFGQITEIKYKPLRNPFRAMVTVGKDPEGRPICKLLRPQAYFPTYNDAYQALLKYNQDPYVAANTMTLAELYAEWFGKSTASDSAKRNYSASWQYCEPIATLPINSIRAFHANSLLANARKTVNGNIIPATPIRIVHIHQLLNQLMNYAAGCGYIEENRLEKVVVDKNIIQQIAENTKSHQIYSEDEMATFWQISAVEPIARMVLIQCYSGWRPSELLALKISAIQDGFMTGGSKTDAGKNRIVPVHPKISHFVSVFVKDAESRGSPYLFPGRDPHNSMAYNTYLKQYRALLAKYQLDASHLPHDGRKQFVTMCKERGVNEYAIKRLVGHQISDITEGTYTERTPEWLRSEIEKI